ncbi:hypothetical protein EFQ99_17495 [Rhizobium vallis]|uniref:Uncharacterized protein n=1 Tax=Rhizobium vallis TaxID=634290 RepID=A0A432PKN7_9HYPH|nr:hypothetical protein EFQ99_17495 [Rhizobium vallis]
MRETSGNKKPARFRRVGVFCNERNSVHASATHRQAVVVDDVDTAKILLMAETLSLGGDIVNVPRMLPRPAVFRLR